MQKRKKILLSILAAAVLIPPTGSLVGLTIRRFWRIYHPNQPLAMPPSTPMERLNPLSRGPASFLFPSPAQRDSYPDHCQNIYNLVCQKQGVTHDPTGTVSSDVDGERQALHIYRELIEQYKDYPGSDEQKVDLIAEALVQHIFNPKQRGRILSAYHWVMQAIERFFERQPDTVFTPLEKHQIKSVLKRTRLEIPPPANVYADEPDLLTKNEVYYERTVEEKMRLRVGGAYIFIAKSWFNLVFTLAHELAHSIDPCEMRSIRLSFPAYDRLTACFLQNGMIKTFKIRKECGQNDQLAETFADWIAVEVTAEALATFSTEFRGPQVINAARNSVRDLCDQDDDDELDMFLHPSPRIRIEKIFGSNSKIRNLLGCHPTLFKPSECSFKGETE